MDLHLKVLQVSSMARLPIVVLLLLVFALGVTLATRDPELKQCKHQCKHQRQFDERQREDCERQCEEYHREKQQREREERESERSRRGRWFVEDDDDDQLMNRYEATDPEKKLRQCQESCDQAQHGGQERSLCRLRCQQRFQRREEEYGEEYPRRGSEEEEEREREFGGENNPYVFRDEHWTSKVRTEHGRFDVLQKFSEKSELLRGIKNFRIGFLEANPQTFIAPCHLDADAVFFVAKGRGTVTIIREDKRDSFNIGCGDVVKVPAGFAVYMINRDSNEKLTLIKFFNPVNLPGHFEDFHLNGYRAFSDELLQAAFKVDRERFERVFRQIQEEVIVKASKEQIQALTHHEEGPRIWPFTKEATSPFNLFRERPSVENKFGQLWEATPEDFRQLRDLDLIISFANITQGSMAGPFYNSKATKIAIVVDGEGYFEMACPHLSSPRGSRTRYQRGRGGGTTSFQKVRSQLRQGTVFVVPPGHPVATVASPNNNLKVICFEVNAQGNVKFPLAGRGNVVSQMEREALELAFGVPAKEVDQVFKSQNEEFFFAGPERQHRRRGIADA